MIDSDQCPGSNRRSFQILRSMADLLVRVRVSRYVSDVIDLRKLETAIDLRIGRRNENLKGDRSEVHMHGNRTWIRGLDVDLILAYISTYINLHQNWQYHYSQITSVCIFGDKTPLEKNST